MKGITFDFQDCELTYRLSGLEKNYESIRSIQATWPLPVPDPKQLYRNFYEMIHKVSYNIVCACCGIIGHNVDEFTMVLTDDKTLALLVVDPEIVPFSFNCGIASLDQHHIMIDPLAITDQNTISICNRCYSSLSTGILPTEALANFRWIGPVPEELKDLT